MEPRDLAGALWRQRTVVLVVFVVTGAAVALGVHLAPKSYSSTAALSAIDNPGAESLAEDLNSLRGTLAELANSREVVEAVVAESGVDRDVEELRRSIDAEWVGGTILIQITAHDENAEVAALVANTVAQVLPFFDPSGAFQFTTSKTAQPAVTYSSPNLLVAAGAGLLLAVVLASVAAVLRDRRRNTVDNARAAEEATTAPLLAHITPPRDPATLPALYPGTAAADMFRHVRIALEVEASNNPVTKVVVTGVTTGETTVWLGANLAISLAKVGRRVLLVDARMGERNGPPSPDEPDTPGLYDVLKGGDLTEALSPGPVEGLTVLPSGRWGGESTDVLVETRFADVMGQAEDRFDIVVVLAPALDACDDARLMAAGGSMLLTVPEGTVSVASLRAHSQRVRSVGARLLGVILVGRRADRIAA
ncbi:MAG TPA: Wzz/FepE/Etk N-terminal domain-containing protein [Nocardioides sp.]|nr:Wzz/FepE/Etk N-terminal domain-containing protein [Nocardioides sp.]